jgi:hypothetical protein
MIAEHALWLRDNRVVENNHRFIVVGNRDAMQRSMITDGGVRGYICNWLVGYLLEPKKFDAMKTLFVRKYRGKLLVLSRGLAKFWSMYETNTKALATGQISRGLRGLSEEKKIQLTAGDGFRQHYHAIKEEYLFEWAEANGYADKETVKALLLGTTEKEEEASN